MSRLRSFCSLAALLALATLLAVPGGALAAKPTVNTVADAVLDVDVCGVPTDITVAGTETVHVQKVVVGGSGPTADFFFEGIIKQKIVVTYVSRANGHVLTQTLNRTLNDVAFVDLGDGYWSFTFSYNGMALRLRDGNTTLIQDTGRLQVTQTFYLGNPDTDADDEFLGETVDSIHGPHPGFDGSAYCDAYAAAMAA